VSDGASGLAVPARDSEALESAVLRLIESPELRKRLGARAAEIVRERADHRKHMADMEALLVSLVEGWGKRGPRR
jgi:glycosyltransferase involved in cell wall biosynthesis